MKRNLNSAGGQY